MLRRAAGCGVILAVVALLAWLGIALADSGTNISATEGSPFTGRVAVIDCTFSSATIDWGDGTPATAGQDDLGSTEGIRGTHTYAEEGTYHGSVTYTSDCMTNATVMFTATVGDAALSATGGNFSETAGQSFSAQVAHFTDADPQGTVSDYNAAIDWGDGSQSAGTVSVSPVGGFDVSGTHTYQSAGPATVNVTITDLGGSLAHSSSTANIAAAPPPRPVCRNVSASTGAGQAIQIRFSCSGTAGYANTYAIVAPPSHGTLSALDSAAGTVTYAPNGGFAGRDSFTYKATNAGGDSNTATVTITVDRTTGPVALISAPPRGSIFALHQKVSMSFACREGVGGPGLRSCVACPSTARASGAARCVSSNRTFAGTVRLDTSQLGRHSYTVTALSRDGQRASATLRFIVARHRPLVFAPPSLVSRARQPCVLYRCPGNPAPHVAWENGLIGLQTNWCADYGCNKPMDLVPANGFDDNMFPFNPDWAYFLHYHQPPNADQLCRQFVLPLSCTSQPTNYDAAGADPSYLICQHGRTAAPGSFTGHVNWEPATYEGTLQWEEHAPPGTDDEYSLQLYPFNLDGATAGNNGGDSMHIEFDSDETIDHFDDDFWWKTFHSGVDDSDGAAHGFIDGTLAEVTGLVGIDTVHTPAAELHPVYGIAIEDNNGYAKDVKRTGNDLWAFFARNWGNEGYCSRLDHGIHLRKLTVRIPWLMDHRGITFAHEPRPATDVKVLGGSADYMNIDAGHAGVSVRKLPGEAVLLTFNLEAPERQSEYWGHIYLRWIFGNPNTATVGLPAGSPGNRAPIQGLPHPRVGEEGLDVEVLVGKLWHQLPNAVRRHALAQIPKLAIRSGRVRKGRLVHRPAPRVPLVGDALYFASPFDMAVFTRGHAEQRALCHAYRNQVPGFPNLCRTRRAR
jgi:hypothetical protein